MRPSRPRDAERRGAFTALALLLVAGAVGLARSSGDASRPADFDASLVDLNGAPESELALLPGLGPDRARRIVVHREIYGPFDSVQDVERVKGIGSRGAEKLRAHAVAGRRGP